MDKIDGDPAAIAATAQQLVAPPMPGSLGRAGTPVNPPGLVEGFLMSIVDKLTSVAAADAVAKSTDKIVTHATDLHRISLEYSWADLTSAATLTGASLKLANQGIGLVKTVTGAGGTAESTDTTGETEKE